MRYTAHSQMSFSRAVGWVCLCCVSLVMAASCTSDTETEPDVPSEPGAQQPSSGGPLLAEADACSQLKSAESSARAALSCSAVARECPSYIRPAGSSGCFQYSKASLDACATLFSSFSDCADFDKHPCLVSATACPSEPGGEGGASGTAGAAGGSGTPSDAGSGGIGEIAGSAGAAGDGSLSAGAGGA